MTDFNINLRFRADGTGAIRIVDQVTGKTREVGAAGRRAGREGSQGMREIGRETARTDEVVGRLTRRLAGVAAAFFSIRTASRVGRQVLDNTLRQEAAFAQLESRVLSTGQAAGFTAEQLSGMAQQIQRETVFANEAIEETQRVLLTFTQITGREFERTTRAVADISTVMGTDLRSAALQVGKALNDPIRGLDGLNRAGIQFNDTQREQIRLMAESGDLAGAQSMILAELETQFGGAARAVRGTFGGALTALNEAFADLLKFQGDLPALADQVERIVERLQDPVLAAAIQELIGAGLELIPPAIDLAVDAFELLIDTGTFLADNFDKIVIAAQLLALWAGVRMVQALGQAAAAKITNIALSAQLATGWQVATTRAVALTTATRALRGSLALLGGPAGAALLAAGALALIARRARDEATPAIDRFRERFGMMRDDLDRFASETRAREDFLISAEAAEAAEARIEAIEQRLERLRAQDFSSLGIRGPQAEAFRTDEIARLTAELEELRDILAQADEQAGGALDNLAAALRDVDGAARGAGDGLNEAATASKEITDPLERQIEALQRQLVELRGGEEALLAWQRARALATAAELDAKEGTDANIRAVNRLFGEIERLTGAVRRQREANQQAEQRQQRFRDAASSTAQTLQNLIEEFDPLEAAQTRLQEQWEEAAILLELTDEQLAELGITSGQVRRALELLARSMGQLGRFDPTQARAVLENLEAQIAAIEGGAEALREFQREQFIKQRLEAAGIDLKRELTAEELRYAEMIREAADHLFDLNNEMERHNRLVSQLGANIARSITQGASLSEALERGFLATGSRGLTEAIEQQIADALGNIDLDSPEFAAASLALGQAIGGDIGAAIGTALGAAIGSVIPGVGTALGAVIGGTIGGLFGGKDPKFQIGGAIPTARGDIAGGTPRGTFDTALGEFGFRFRNIPDESAQELIVGVQEFFAVLAAALPRALDSAAAETLRDFEFDSKDHGESARQLLTAMFDEVVAGLDGSVQAVVNRGTTLEDRLQRLADVFTIQGREFLGDTLGIDGSSIELVDELSRANESLLDTYERLLTTVEAFDTGLLLTGNIFAGTREEMIRFADELADIFGDDTGRLTGGLNRIFERFFSDEERFEVAADQARQRARELFAELGIDFAEELLSETGFRDLFNELFGLLSPEDTALLIEAGVAVDEFLAAMERIPGGIGDVVDDLSEQIADFMSSIDRGIVEVLSPATAEYLRLSDAIRENFARAEELRLSEQQFARVRQLAVLQVRAFAADLEASLESLAASLARSLGRGQMEREVTRPAERTMTNLRNVILRGLQSIDDVLDRSLLGRFSPLTSRERLAEAESQFADALAAAEGGDAEAIQDASRLFDVLIGEAAQRFGTSTDEFREIFDRAREQLESLRAGVRVPDEPTGAQQREIAQNTRDTAISASEQLRQAVRMADEIGLLSEITGKSPAEIAREVGDEFGISIDDLIRILTDEVPDLTGDALEEFFNDLVTEQREAVTELSSLETISVQQLTVLRRIESLLGGEPGDKFTPPTGSSPEPPAFAAGGFASGIIRTGERGRELVLPNPVTEFFTRVGIPFRSTDSAELREVADKLDQIRALTQQANNQRDDHIRTTDQGTRRIAERQAELVSEARRQRRIRPVATLSRM